MAETATVQVIQNGYRNVVLRASLVSDGSGVTNQKIFNATSGGVFGVTVAGQTFYPGIHTKLIGLDFDVQDQKFRLDWEATPNYGIVALGTSPESFDWKDIGGLPVPVVAGVTGSILLSTIDPMVDATLTLVLKLRKGVPQS